MDIENSRHCGNDIEMNTDLNTFALAENPCRADLDPLVPFLQGARKSPVQIQAHAVDNLGAIRLQILLSARNKWRDEQVAFEVVNTSSAFQKSLSLLGLSGTVLYTEALGAETLIHIKIADETLLTIRQNASEVFPSEGATIGIVWDDSDQMLFDGSGKRL